MGFQPECRFDGFDEEVEFSLVDHQPSGQSSAVGFGTLGELANDAAALISVFRKPHIGLLLKGGDGFPNLQGFQETGFCEVGQKLRRGPTAAFGSEMLPEPGRDDGMTGKIKLPFLDLGEACAYVFWKRAIDCYAGHSGTGVSEPLEIGFGFPHALERCRVVGHHVNADDVPSMVVHRIPEADVTVLHTSLLDVWEEVGRSVLPAVLFFCHNASRVVFTEGSLGELRVAQFGAETLGAARGPLAFCRYGHPIGRTGRLRAVGLARPGAKPPMAHLVWPPEWPARRRPRTGELFWTAGSGDLWPKHGRCGR